MKRPLPEPSHGSHGTPRGDEEPRGPVRSCIVCRAKASPDDLVRLTVDPYGVGVVDFRGKLGGRGAWCHPRCLPELERQPRRLEKPLKCPVAPGPWTQQFTEALQRAIEDGLSMASAAGALVGGRAMLVDALQHRAILGVVVAHDASERTLQDLREAAHEGVPFTTLNFLSTAELGARTGKGMRAAVGIRSSRAAHHLLRQLRTLRALG